MILPSTTKNPTLERSRTFWKRDNKLWRACLMRDTCRSSYLLSLLTKPNSQGASLSLSLSQELLSRALFLITTTYHNRKKCQLLLEAIFFLDPFCFVLVVNGPFVCNWFWLFISVLVWRRPKDLQSLQSLTQHAGRERARGGRTDLGSLGSGKEGVHTHHPYSEPDRDSY